MKRIGLAFMATLLFTLLACGPGVTPTPMVTPTPVAAPTPQITPSPTPTPKPIPTPEATPTPSPMATPKLTPQPTPEPTPAEEAPVELKVIEPQDESIVYSSPVVVRGTAWPDAVVSVDGQMAEVDEEGNFEVSVSLEEGPNLIEVVASDFRGNERRIEIAVIYIPQ